MNQITQASGDTKLDEKQKSAYAFIILRSQIVANQAADMRNSELTNWECASIIRNAPLFALHDISELRAQKPLDQHVSYSLSITNPLIEPPQNVSITRHPCLSIIEQLHSYIHETSRNNPNKQFEKAISALKAAQIALESHYDDKRSKTKHSEAKPSSSWKSDWIEAINATPDCKPQDIRDPICVDNAEPKDIIESLAKARGLIPEMGKINQDYLDEISVEEQLWVTDESFQQVQSELRQLSHFCDQAKNHFDTHVATPLSRDALEWYQTIASLPEECMSKFDSALSELRLLQTHLKPQDNHIIQHAASTVSILIKTPGEISRKLESLPVTGIEKGVEKLQEVGQSAADGQIDKVTAAIGTEAFGITGKAIGWAIGLFIKLAAGKLLKDTGEKIQKSANTILNQHILQPIQTPRMEESLQTETAATLKNYSKFAEGNNQYIDKLIGPVASEIRRNILLSIQFASDNSNQLKLKNWLEYPENYASCAELVQALDALTWPSLRTETKETLLRNLLIKIDLTPPHVEHIYDYISVGLLLTKCYNFPRKSRNAYGRASLLLVFTKHRLQFEKLKQGGGWITPDEQIQYIAQEIGTDGLPNEYVINYILTHKGNSYGTSSCGRFQKPTHTEIIQETDRILLIAWLKSLRT